MMRMRAMREAEGGRRQALGRFDVRRTRAPGGSRVSPVLRSWLPILAIGSMSLAAPEAPTPLKAAGVRASSAMAKYAPEKAVDGVVSDDSRWVSEKSDAPAWLEIELGATQKLAGVHLFTGWGERDPVAAFTIQFRDGGAWRDIPSATVANNTACALAIPFDDTVPVVTDALRLRVVASHQGSARVKEIVVWPAGAGGVPPLPERARTAGAGAQAAIPPLYLNQSGFNLGKPKRFTAPTLADGTRFAVRDAKGGPALAEGVVRGGKGDFTAFDPADAREFVVEAGGIVSVPFRVGPWWLERVTYQRAMDFMIDSRHHVGNDRAVCQGSFGWRDDHHFGWELHTLVPQYLSNPSAYERMPRQIRYERPSKPGLWGALEPYRDDAPDIVKLIHWGADVIVSQGLTHEHLKAQLAYFLHAWPVLEPWMPRQAHDAVLDYTFRTWGEKACDRKYPYDESPEHDLFALKTGVGTTKGCYPPGFSIEPNLLMAEVARRENRREDASRFFEAARRQTAWIVENLDWNDPQTTKGQRMSEFLTMTGLAHFLRRHPDQAPPGLAKKIADWAAVAIRRSDNLWDFRKLDDGARWTPMGEKPTMWNEPGNVAGLPAALLAACEVLPEGPETARLRELAWSHFDAMFGRNPVGRHFSYDAPRELEGVEFGWFKFYPGGIGRLAEARFVIDGSPKDGHYPYHPEKGDFGWTEGWVQFNAAFNVSLAHLAFAETRIDVRRDGDAAVVRLRAPLNFDYGRAETGTVVVTSGGGDVERLAVVETSASSFDLEGRIRLQPGAPPIHGDGILQTDPAATVEAVYGHGYLGRSCRKKL
ncbi:MAG: hypothetical protein FJ221_10415 [Lentisphaerae bacterium]|nr:hypothetical protein [Lentisphaerota bacterium]